MRACLLLLAVCVAMAYSAPYPVHGPAPRGYAPGPAPYGPRSYGPAQGAYNRGGYGPAPGAYGRGGYGPAPGAYGRGGYGPAPRAYGPAPGAYGGPSQSYGGPSSSSYGSNTGRSFGREMHYTVRGPGNQGTMKVKETHVSMDRQMNPQEAEQAMKNIMGSMGDARGQYQDFVKSIGLNVPFY